ncbi:hypothetical protein [Pseudomonas urethralis]|uniref:hypothetical protein n=1 Tax=Pseudomonas urethralis TaxID=2740517 RepID=UPI001596B8FC|nr:hypothetical protein [Pseudomonas urethralis]
MAEYGLTIKNSSGYVQIDGEYSNLALVESLTLSATSRGGGPNGSVWYVTRSFPNYVSPVVAIYANNGVTVCYQAAQVNGVWQFTFWATTQNAFQVYMFDQAGRGARFAINYGLVVKNKTTNAVVFDSRMKYMRVVDYIAANLGGNYFDNISKDYTAYKKVAIVQGAFWATSIQEVIPDDPTDPTAITLIEVSGMLNHSVNGISIQVMDTYSNSNRLSQNPLPNWYCNSYSYLVLDVSDFD